MVNLRQGGPVVLLLASVVWSLVVAPYAKYGDRWATVPVLVAFVVAVAWHLGLIVVTREARWRMVLYAVIHLPLFFYIGLLAVQHITKDAL